MRPVVVIATLVLLVGCQDHASDRSGLPAPVSQTRAEILKAADDGDYEVLRPLIERGAFRGHW
jgi:hypothetical protein